MIDKILSNFDTVTGGFSGANSNALGRRFIFAWSHLGEISHAGCLDSLGAANLHGDSDQVFWPDRLVSNSRRMGVVVGGRVLAVSVFTG